MRRYEFRSGSRIKVDPQRAGEIIERIAAEQGSASAPAIVDAARDPESPLHDAFEWDDSVAAEEYRCEQARHMTRSLIVRHVEDDGEGGESRTIAFIHIHAEEEDGGDGYRASEVVYNRADFRAQAIEDALKLLNGVRLRYAHLSELDGVFAEIDRAKKARERKAARKRAGARKR